MAPPVRPETQLPNRGTMDPDEVRFIKQRWLEGWGQREILDDCTQEFVSRDAAPHFRHGERDRFRRAIAKFFEDPRSWDPDIDEQAVYRAFMGDEEVWIALTHYERLQVVEKLIAVYETKKHPRWPELDGVEAVHEWARKVGEDPGRIANILNKRRSRELAAS